MKSLLPWEQVEEIVGLRMRELNLGLLLPILFSLYSYTQWRKNKFLFKLPTLKKWLNWNMWIFIQILFCSSGQTMVNYENYILFPCIQTRYNVMVQILNSRVEPFKPACGLLWSSRGLESTVYRSFSFLALGNCCQHVKISGLPWWNMKDT